MNNNNFIIFGHGRSGSTLLRTLLNCHPRVVCELELLSHKRLSKKHPIAQHIIFPFPIQYLYLKVMFAKKDVFGFKLLMETRKNAEQVLKKLYLKNWKVIYIQRKNIIKQSISLYIGRQTQQWVRRPSRPSPTEIYHIEPQELLKFIDQNISYLEQENKLLENIDYLHVVYEDDLFHSDNWQKTADRIFGFLGISSVDVSSKNVMTDLRTDAERIENFDDTIQFLEYNGYSALVEEYYAFLAKQNQT